MNKMNNTPQQSEGSKYGHRIIGKGQQYAEIHLPQGRFFAQLDTSDMFSTSFSEGSTTVPDANGRCLRRVLKQKFRRLRSLTNENMTPELDRIVCRLMKLALYTSQVQQNPPPTTWMLNKLFDLLTLTEKAIEKRRRHFLDNFSFKAIEYNDKDNKNENTTINNPHTTEDISAEIMSKYQHILEPSDLKDETADFVEDQLEEPEFNDSITSNEFTEYEYHETDITEIKDIDDTFVMDHQPNDIEFNYLQSYNNTILEMTSTDPLSYMDCKTFTKPYNNVDNGIHINPSIHVTDPNFEINMENSEAEINVTPKRTLSEEFNNMSKFSKHNITPKSSRLRRKNVSSKGSRFKLLKNQSAASIDHKNKKRKLKEHQKLQSKLSKPIPDSLINLCNLDNDPEKIEIPNNILADNTNIISNGDESSIAATEKIVFIAIVTESREETIALRRNIGTDPDVINDIKNENVSETVINVTDNSFNYKSYMNVENESDTIFLNDINEPSTSKGIRNFSTDVQCGPDSSQTYPLSPRTSLTKFPTLFNYGIKIEDSYTKIWDVKNTCDFSMCTECDDKSIDVSKNVVLTFKDSNNVCEKNDFLVKKTLEEISIDDKHITTTLLKPKIEYSDSEFCGSLGSFQKSPTRMNDTSKNTSESQIQCFWDNNLLPCDAPSKKVTQKLVWGGTRVHSFKEKNMNSEDIVYQGKWQRAPKILAKKLSSEASHRKRALIQKRRQKCLEENSAIGSSSTSPTKRFTKKLIPITRKEKNMSKEFMKEIGPQRSKDTQKFSNVKNTTNARNIVRVFSKVTLRTHVINDKIKNIKIINSQKTTNFIASSDNKPYKGTRKNYLPLYLRKRIKNIIENKENKSDSKCFPSPNDEEINCPKTEDIVKDLLKLSKDTKSNISYVVLRNSIEAEQDIDKKLPLSPEETDITAQPSYSPQSQNSSTCSSPNSVATVRAMKMVRKKIMSNQRDSISERSSSGLDTDNVSTKPKYIKRSKMYKKLPVCCNKENVPQSSKNCYNEGKNISITNKNVFVGKTKSVYMVHGNEISNLQSSSTKCSKKSVRLIDDKSLIKDIKIDDGTLSTHMSLNNKDYGVNDNNSVHILEEKENKDLTFNLNTNFSNNYSVINNKQSSEIQNDFSKSPGRSLHNTTSSIMSAIRQLLEDKIHTTDNNSQESSISASETVILNKDELNQSINSDLTPLNTNNDFIIESGSPLEKFSSSTKIIEQDESVLSFAGAKILNEDLDTFSFKSIESMPLSKFSDYYLADSETGNIDAPQIVHLDNGSFQNIFERNDQNKNYKGPGILEGLSGFSVNAEPFPVDHVNLIDSETGSYAPTSARLTASEEIYISGRSSDTYESCFFEDDSFVPNWLFEAISQQQSAEDSEVLEEPLEVPQFAVNDTPIEPGVGVTSGAGDGRGIHSDRSQDSSGRGTSLSSTASSGPDTDTILFIDFSAATGHVPPANLTSNDVPEGNINAGNRSSANPEQTTSDVEADVSSIDTDAIDSDT